MVMWNTNFIDCSGRDRYAVRGRNYEPGGSDFESMGHFIDTIGR